MISKDALIKAAIAVAILGFVINVIINLPSYTKIEEKRFFPQVVGDMVLRSNETGVQIIRNITSYDDFRGDIIQGFQANYSGFNGTMIVFIAQMRDNSSATASLKDMVIRAGYNETSVQNENASVIKVPSIKNPEIFVMLKKVIHYTYAKSDKVYWIAFSKQNPSLKEVSYQLDMLKEIYLKVDKV